MDGELRAVDDNRGPGPHGLEPLTFQRDRLSRGVRITSGDEGVTTAGLFEALNEELILCVKEDHRRLIAR
jgi:hypothetical protein